MGGKNRLKWVYIYGKTPIHSRQVFPKHFLLFYIMYYSASA